MEPVRSAMTPSPKETHLYEHHKIFRWLMELPTEPLNREEMREASRTMDSFPKRRQSYKKWKKFKEVRTAYPFTSIPNINYNDILKYVLYYPLFPAVSNAFQEYRSPHQTEENTVLPAHVNNTEQMIVDPVERPIWETMFENGPIRFTIPITGMGVFEIEMKPAGDKDPDLVCQMCDESFFTSDERSQHEEVQHPDEKRADCFVFNPMMFDAEENQWQMMTATIFYDFVQFLIWGNSPCHCIAFFVRKNGRTCKSNKNRIFKSINLFHE